MAYERYATQILIGWTEQDTARFVLRDYSTPREEWAKSPLGLVKAREWLAES